MTISDRLYFAHPFLNNSGLSGKGFKCKQAILDFGSLVHAAILQPERLDLIRYTLDGDPVKPEDMKEALKMKRSFMMNDFCRALLNTSRTEVEIYDPNTPFEYNGVKFCLDTKRKYDLLNDVSKIGGDIKTTSATTREGFLKDLDSLDYDRGRVFYAKGSGVKADIVIGISKINYEIFIVHILEGSYIWKRGEAKLNKLAYEYFKNNLPC